MAFSALAAFFAILPVLAHNWNPRILALAAFAAFTAVALWLEFAIALTATPAHVPTLTRTVAEGLFAALATAAIVTVCLL